MMLKKLIKEELVSLKRQGFDDKFHIQRLQQMIDEDITFEKWQSTGQMMQLSEFVKYYPHRALINMVSMTTENILRYAGGLVIELGGNGEYFVHLGICFKFLCKNKNLEKVEKELYKHYTIKL